LILKLDMGQKKNKDLADPILRFSEIVPFFKKGKIKVLFYSHDTLGLGHLQRNLKIARILKSVYNDFDITLLTGSLIVSHFELPEGVDFISLPPVRKTGNEEYDSYYTGESFKSVAEKRKSVILDTVKKISPDIFWVDHAPIGMKEELRSALEWLDEQRGTTIKILGLRDIIDAPSNIIPLWKEQKIYDILRSLYDRIFIYGDPAVFDPVPEYRLTPDIIEKTSYTGYIMNKEGGLPAATAEAESIGKKRIFVTIGGGEWAGETIIGNLLLYLRKFKNSKPYEFTFVTGPFFPEDLWNRFSHQAEELPVRFDRFLPDIRPLISSSDLVISTAGYNTVTDVLGYGSRAIFIPRIKFRQEQLLRSERFAGKGVVDMMHPEDVTPDSLYERITDILESEERPIVNARRKSMIDIGGAEFVSRFIGELVPAAEK
jgi:predicted glycosyltransferase